MMCIPIIMMRRASHHKNLVTLTAFHLLFIGTVFYLFFTYVSLFLNSTTKPVFFCIPAHVSYFIPSSTLGPNVAKHQRNPIERFHFI